MVMAYPVSPSLPIKSWAEDDRPREKLLLKGPRALSDAELIAILLGSGTREETALGLARQLLRRFHDNIPELSRATSAELMAIRGIGEAKAVAVLAALELGRRRQMSEARSLPAIVSSRDAYELLAPLMADLDREEFWLLLLNRANKVLAVEQISAGGITSTVVDPKLVFRKALDARATGIILSHNHPSGQLKPSDPDIALTRKLRQAGQVLEISIVDHIIITHSGYVSFADEGL